MDEKEKIFHDLFTEYHEILFKTCVGLTGDHLLADEIVQEAYVRLWCVWDVRVSCDPAANKCWLYRTMRNIMHEVNRQSMRTQPADPEVMAEVPSENLISQKEESLQYEHYITVVRKLLKPGEYRIFDLYVIKGLTYREISGITNKKESTIRCEISRLRKKLKPVVKKLLKEN